MRVARNTTFPINLAHSALILFVHMSTFHQGGCSISSLSPLAPAHQANSIFLTDGICLPWPRTLWRTTFKMSSFTRVQTYSSSWCSQVWGESQLYWLTLVFREGLSLRSYTGWIHKESRYVTLGKTLNISMSQFPTLQNGFKLALQGLMKSSCKHFGQQPGLHETMGDDYFCYHDVSQAASPLQSLSRLALSQLRLMAAQSPEALLNPSLSFEEATWVWLS